MQIKMPIYNSFYCPWKKKHIIRCSEGWHIVQKKDCEAIEFITCRYWKKGQKCLYKEKSQRL